MYVKADIPSSWDIKSAGGSENGRGPDNRGKTVANPKTR